MGQGNWKFGPLGRKLRSCASDEEQWGGGTKFGVVTPDTKGGGCGGGRSGVGGNSDGKHERIGTLADNALAVVGVASKTAGATTAKR